MELLSKASILMVLVTLLAIGGCAAPQGHESVSTRPSDTHGTTLPEEVANDSAALTEWIGNQAYVTQDAGFRAVYALWKGESKAGSFDAVAAELRDGHIIGRSWHDDPQRLLTRAKTGYMVCRATNIQTGLNWQLFGFGRYAWRELIYRDIAQPSSEMNYISGGEFLGIITRADEYASKTGKAPPANLDLGPRPH